MFDWKKDHLTAGNCTFTAVDGNGDHLTFRVKISNPVWNNPDDHSQGLKRPQVFFVGLLTGPANTRDFSGFATMNREDGSVKLFNATRFTYDTTAVKVADLILTSIFAGKLPDGIIRVDAPDRCVKCGKVLTVPVEGNPYRAYGYGPDCGPRMMTLPGAPRLMVADDEDEGGYLPDADDYDNGD